MREKEKTMAGSRMLLASSLLLLSVMQINLTIGQQNPSPYNNLGTQRFYVTPWVPPHERPGSGFIAAKEPRPPLKFTPRDYAPSQYAAFRYGPAPKAMNGVKNNVAFRNAPAPKAMNALKNNVAFRNAPAAAAPKAMNALKNNVAFRNAAAATAPKAMNALKNNVAFRNGPAPKAMNALKNNVAFRNAPAPKALNGVKNNVAFRYGPIPPASNGVKNNPGFNQYRQPMQLNNANPANINFGNVPHIPSVLSNPQVTNAMGYPKYQQYSPPPPPHLRLPVPGLEQPNYDDDADESTFDYNDNLNTNIEDSKFLDLIMKHLQGLIAKADEDEGLLLQNDN